MCIQVVFHSVVVNQGVIHVNQKYQAWHHGSSFLIASLQRILYLSSKERQRHIKGRTLALNTFNPYFTTMTRHQLMDEVQSNTQSTYRTIKVACSVKTFEDMGQFTACNPHPMIFDPDKSLPRLLLCKAQTNLNFTAR